MSPESKKVETDYLKLLEERIVELYAKYQDIEKNKLCSLKKKLVSDPKLGFDPFHINLAALKESINHIKMDFKILKLRRGKLIGNLRMSEGKIAGIIVYRLSKTHIIHIHKICNNSCPHKTCFPMLNITFAIRVGLDYINKIYSELPKGIRNELIYTIRHRHVNQETLGLVFDALLTTNNQQIVNKPAKNNKAIKKEDPISIASTG